jgi:hypothetical protein
MRNNLFPQSSTLKMELAGSFKLSNYQMLRLRIPDDRNLRTPVLSYVLWSERCGLCTASKPHGIIYPSVFCYKCIYCHEYQ